MRKLNSLLRNRQRQQTDCEGNTLVSPELEVVIEILSVSLLKRGWTGQLGFYFPFLMPV
jgi:hypothetical protein